MRVNTVSTVMVAGDETSRWEEVETWMVAFHFFGGALSLNEK